MEHYIVTLEENEVAELNRVITRLKNLQEVARAKALLLLDKGKFSVHKENLSMKEIAVRAHVSVRTLERIAKKYVEDGLEGALNRKKAVRAPRDIIFDAGVEAVLMHIALNTLPEGRAKWTLQLLANKMIELKIVSSISPTSVKNLLKRNGINIHSVRYWKKAPQNDADFCAFMEDLLKLYKLVRNPKRPIVCIDESNKQLIINVRPTMPNIAGHSQKIDPEYARCGVVEIFLSIDPHTGKMRIEVKKTRTKIDFAYFIRDIVDIDYPDADKVILVMDNLNTHKIGSLYAAFPPEEASRIAERIEIHYTPKYGSWLNVAEVGLSVLKRECLRDRMSSPEEVQSHINTWLSIYNSQDHQVDWKFSVNDARTKLKYVYPKIAGLNA